MELLRSRLQPGHHSISPWSWLQHLQNSLGTCTRHLVCDHCLNHQRLFVLSWGVGGCRVLLGSDSTTISLTHFLLTDSPPPSTVLQWTSIFTSLYTSVWASIWSVSQRWAAGSKGICILNIIYFWHAAPQNGSTFYTSTSTAVGFFSFHAHSPLKCASFEGRKAVSHHCFICNSSEYNDI